MEYPSPETFKIYKREALQKVMFTQKDINNTDHTLMKMIKIIIHNEKITLEDFINNHDSYMKSINISLKEANYKKNNLLKALLKRDEITWKLFEYILINVLEMNINKFHMQFINGNGVKKEFEIITSF